MLGAGAVDWRSTWICKGAEAAAERDLLFWHDVLIAEHKQVIIEVGAVETDEIVLAGQF